MHYSPHAKYLFSCPQKRRRAKNPRGAEVRIKTNNAQERANREIKRRTRVVQSFPSRESLIRLVGSALIEAEAEWSTRCVISTPSLTHAWKREERDTFDGTRLEELRQAATRIIERAIGPDSEEL